MIRGNNDLHVTVWLTKIMAKCIKHKATILWKGLLNILKKVSSIKNFTQNVKSYCGQQALIVRISSLVYNVTNFYPETGNIFSLLSTFGICC